MHIHTYIHACMHACMHTYIHTYNTIQRNTIQYNTIHWSGRSPSRPPRPPGSSPGSARSSCPRPSRGSMRGFDYKFVTPLLSISICAPNPEPPSPAETNKQENVAYEVDAKTEKARSFM